MTIEAFISLLDGVRQTRRGYVATCPAHEDRSPSLHLAEGEDGLILLHDFAGCTTEEITAALGLKLTDLFPDSRKPSTEIRRKQEERLRKKATEEAARHREGLRMDALREADYFIHSRKDMDISVWSDADLDSEMDCLSLAYRILEEEAAHDVR